MHILTNTKSVQKAIATVIGAVEKKNTIPVLSCVLLRAQNDQLLITASDMEIEITTVIPLEKNELKRPGECCVDAGTLSQIFSKTVSAAIDLKTKDSRLLITFEASSFKLNTLPTSDFPTMPNDFEKNFNLSASILRTLLDTVAFCTSTEETRYYLQGIYLENTNGSLTAVATDGHRLALSRESESQCDVPSIIVPRKTIREILKLVEKDDEINLSATRRQIRICFGRTTIVSKLIDGTFPEYDRVIPKNNDNAVTFNAELLRGAIERVMCVASKTHSVKIDIKDRKATVSSRNDNGEATETINIDHEGPSISIGMNGQYAISALEKIKGKAKLMLSRPETPLIINDTTNPDALFLIMPMRVA